MCSTCRTLWVTWEQVEVGQPMLVVPDYGSTGGEKDAERLFLPTTGEFLQENN